jgi:ribonuclease HI
LVSEATASPHAGDEPAGRWRFVLQTDDGQTCLAAEDDEPEGSSERLHLLAIVRGLEALDEPSRVTLVTAGRSISRGIRYGVAQWRENDWQWERYGKLTPVKNGDLWRRIDRAMAIHNVACRDATPATDDLAEPPDALRETADVRIIHRNHRSRKLRIDPGTGADDRRPRPAWSGTRQPRPSLLALARSLVDRLRQWIGPLTQQRSIISPSLVHSGRAKLVQCRKARREPRPPNSAEGVRRANECVACGHERPA